jgi:hypothetical protein
VRAARPAGKTHGKHGRTRPGAPSFR